jgi:mycothiol S-conjugate amidase
MEERLRLMAVHAHPDDESSKGGGTMARYAAEGHEVLVVSCTGGERGDVLNPRLQHDPEILRDLPEVRRREMAQAQRILGFQHTWLGFVDSGLPQGDPLPPLPEGCFALEPIEVTTEALVRVIRDFKPHVITTYDETGGYPHPDHIMCHLVAMSAFAAAGDATAYEHCGQAWQPLKLYYIQTLTKARITAYHNAMEAAGIESPFGDWLPFWEDRVERTITTKVQCADYFDLRDQALLAHATQVDPDGLFFKVPMRMKKEIMPTEDYEAALSFVPIEPVEPELFTGLGSPEQATALATSAGLQIAYDGRVGADE